MFFIIIFFFLAALTSHFFPTWPWFVVVAISLGCVAALRLSLFYLDRSGKAAKKPPLT